jgi:hypothetical protein
MLSTTTHYMVNPSILMPPPQTTIMPFPRKREQTSSPEDSEEEEEYQPGPSISTSKRAKKAPSGGGSGNAKGTKMSREALRKANHSLIERRRREKINFALGDLRGMVPGLGEEKGGKAGEFKLEVCRLAALLLVAMIWTLTFIGPGTYC